MTADSETGLGYVFSRLQRFLAESGFEVNRQFWR